ncbi:single-stranded-DNA-specific exonuclease RecJ [Lysobacteraceae bacterium NML120232]|nr:single-stranded-DNA-specific exonuclease RecJ [Xanthomonadaceae bacterium NML120232]
MNTQILRRPLPENTEALAALSPLLRRLHGARGAQSIDSAQPRLAHLPSPDLMKGMDAAVALLHSAIMRNAHIRVVGDFDCDGATGCAVLMRGLKMLGARSLSFAVPDRQLHGYGLSPTLVEELAADAPDLILTVDTGIACVAGVAAARAHGMQVIICDHHLPGPTLPAADAIVNPNQPGCTFPSKALAGVGVAFYLLLALRAHLRQQGDTAGDADLSALLDLVAVGTVADVVPLDTTNRALVAAGLRRIRQGRAHPGVRALINAAKRQEATLTPADIGFAVAPRINAAGRLEDMTLGIACLLSDNSLEAEQLAQLLSDINQERRQMQAQMLQDAESLLADTDLANARSRLAISLYQPHWHPGVVGLVASNVKEKLHRPVIAFAPASPDSEELRGSARSISGFHIRDALAWVDAHHPGLITRFGGHAMAAGLSLAREKLHDFAQAFEAAAEILLPPESLQKNILSDGELAAEDFNLATAILLRDGGVWGQHYPEPLFDGEFAVLDWRVLGEKHLKLTLACGMQRLNAIHFGGWDGTPPTTRQHIAYRLTPDDWRGGDAIQLIVVHREPLG